MNAFIRIAIVVTVGFAPVALGGDQNLTVKAPDYLVPLSQAWAQGYGKSHSGFRLQVSGAASAPAVFEALSGKQADLVGAPRAIKFKESQACEAALGKKPLDFKLGVNGVAVYVAGANPVKTVTYAELEAVFTGKCRNWKELGGNDAPIEIICQEPTTVSGELFKDEVLGGKEFSSDARRMNDADIIATIAKNPNAIGFGRLVLAGDAKALSIKRAPSSTPVAPTEDTISNRIYPISRYLFGYLSPLVDKPETKAFLDWARSDEGQQIVKETGFFPLPPKLRASH